MTLRQVTWKQRWEFLRSHLAQPNQIGAVTPSSRFLARAMLKAAPVDNALVVAELGAGTGVFTDHMLARLRPDALVDVFIVVSERYVTIVDSLIGPATAGVLLDTVRPYLQDG